MKIMIAGAWDETNENLLSSAFQIAKVAAEKKHIIITGGGTGIPHYYMQYLFRLQLMLHA